MISYSTSIFFPAVIFCKLSGVTSISSTGDVELLSPDGLHILHPMYPFGGFMHVKQCVWIPVLQTQVLVKSMNSSCCPLGSGSTNIARPARFLFR